ncbi:xanthine dehydrogenase family protein molybdopterin-binding subunit [Saccharopolyspora phatthalungensis]|uniref:Xanthine dehydrogenase YagR molybdenum-binding subunit n=1 Tax=Saccharopolyspora phatthalungensis TaxID=664693 RepID=A0A840QIA2_9PSEU|nr:xanthine dehydrogenase family protein molybdopterin-binding subunit [Saccharopolyspora phatthalungensis]MBB5157093.1 xanthine dehydrogenase YagR molybdenum-binding subunit [Saccharopolyspora phatthalungensis]
MTTTTLTRSVGQAISRVEGGEKVRGQARYAFEQPVHRPAYLFPLQAPIAAGRVTSVDASAALAEEGVLTVFTHENAPELAPGDDPELAILQSDRIAFRGQFVGGIIAETLETARHAASLVRIQYQPEPHDADFRVDRDDLYAPDHINPSFATDTDEGDVEAALASAAVTLDETYTTPPEINNPLEPHATIAVWYEDELTLYDATQGVTMIQHAVAPLFGLAPEQVHVIAPHVGGGFGAKVTPHGNVVLAAMAAKLVASRPVKLALTRHQMFSVVGSRTATAQRIRLGADTEGGLAAISHDVIEESPRFKEFAEQTAVCTRTMYAAPSRRTTHRLVALDIPPLTFMRAPGEAPGMFALESAMDEMAIACDLDPVEFRIRNEPELDPETGLPYSSRSLVSCLLEGARRFDWAHREPTPGVRRQNGWLVGTGVAASTYPVFRIPGSSARVAVAPNGRYVVQIAAMDIGTGTWTALRQLAADELGAPFEEVELQIGDSALPGAAPAGGSVGLGCWGTAIHNGARELRERLETGGVPEEGLEAIGTDTGTPYEGEYAMHSFGAQFAEVWVREDSGEIRVPRLLGIFAAGRIINPTTARSQLLGGMTMGLSMALHEAGFVDPRFGHVVNHDFATYHIATNADVGTIEVDFLHEDDPYVNPLGTKGIGELGIVGTAAAIANAAHHATGIRVRDLPITLDKLLS